MARRRPSERQTAIETIDMRPRPLPDPPSIPLRAMELGVCVGMYQGKNTFIELCDRCHEPGVKLGERWYHSVPTTSPCVLTNAPRPNPVALARVLKWYQWCVTQARAASVLEAERARELERIVQPMQPYLLTQIARVDRRHLPTVSECRMIYTAMQRVSDESWIDPVELEEWTARNTS